MNYQLDDVVRQISGKVTANCNFAIFTVVLDLLDEEHADILRQSCLWPLYSLRNVQFSGQIFDALLCRLLKPVDGDALHFNLGGKVVRFSIFEFSMITGLMCTAKDAARARIPRNNRLLNEYFHGQAAVTPGQLIDAVRACEDMSTGHHKKTSIDFFHLEIVDDIDAFNSYPWGQRCFADTLRHFRREYSMPKGVDPSASMMHMACRWHYRYGCTRLSPYWLTTMLREWRRAALEFINGSIWQATW